jgi:hypothetical protein
VERGYRGRRMFLTHLILNIVYDPDRYGSGVKNIDL